MRLSGAIIYTWEVFYMLNILFALDDSEKSERLIKFFKESKDIDFVDVCHDGTSASYKLGENKYQAVIIDLLLPGYDGFYLLNKYAKPVGAPKFIVISGINREEFINKAFSSRSVLFHDKSCRSRRGHESSYGTRFFFSGKSYQEKSSAQSGRTCFHNLYQHRNTASYTRV